MAETIAVVNFGQGDCRVDPGRGVRGGFGAGKGDVNGVCPRADGLATNVFNESQKAFPVMMVVGDVKGCGARGIDVVRGTDQGVVD